MEEVMSRSELKKSFMKESSFLRLVMEVKKNDRILESDGPLQEN
jgi:hypothetical protein